MSCTCSLFLAGAGCADRGGLLAVRAGRGGGECAGGVVARGAGVAGAGLVVSTGQVDVAVAERGGGLAMAGVVPGQAAWLAAEPLAGAGGGPGEGGARAENLVHVMRPGDIRKGTVALSVYVIMRPYIFLPAFTEQSAHGRGRGLKACLAVTERGRR